MVHVTSFYKFMPLDREGLPSVQQSILADMADLHLLGTVILSVEGINATVAGNAEATGQFKSQLCNRFGDIRFKDSTCAAEPFRRAEVVIRKEIVTMKRELIPEGTEATHLSSSEWHEMLLSDQPKVLIDTRNDYETLAGKFRGAIDPGLKRFSDWEAYLDSTEFEKDVPVMIYCTGGIRCEKAIIPMLERGFEKVYQLRDGILGYLAEYPDGEYEGECYVFDGRVAVDQHLRPSQTFAHCATCGATARRAKEGESYCEACATP